MTGIILPIVALLVIMVVSFVIIRISAITLTRTGLSSDASNFQAMSAFFSVGFTTSEAELVVNHPVRRRIIMHTIIAGNVVMTGVIGSIVVTFVQSLQTDRQIAHPWAALGLILGGAILLLWISRFKLLRRGVDRAINAALRRSGTVRPVDYEHMFRYHAGFCVMEVKIEETHPLVGQTLARSDISDRNMVVLGITRKDGEFLAAPGGKAVIEIDDDLLVFGREADVDSLGDPESETRMADGD